jgi:hypothetical protein
MDRRHASRRLRKSIIDPITLANQWKSPLPKGFDFPSQVPNAHLPSLLFGFALAS